MEPSGCHVSRESRVAVAAPAREPAICVSVGGDGSDLPGPIRGVLFDSGGTLVGPRGGRWNPRFDFEDVLLSHVRDVETARFAAAFEAGEEFLRSGTATKSRNDYHRVVLAALGIEPTRSLLADLTGPPPGPVFELFPEVRNVVAELHERNIAMAIVTDNWGTSRAFLARMDAIGLRGISACVVSEELGCAKPDPRMYHTASDALGLAPHECLFVDDVPELVAAALDLGYRGTVICRPPANPPDNLPYLESLSGVVEMVRSSMH